MPKKDKQKIIVTSALPYVNNVPHLGTLMCIISADVYSRFLRLKKENVIFICGTDEYGTTAEVRAIEEDISPKQLVNKYFKIHKEIYDGFDCSFDHFGRTTSKENEKIAIDIFNKLDQNKYIIEGELEQAFCEKCDKSLADRFVEGKCPHCSYEHARGDQCENCAKLLNAAELIDAKCKICGSAPIIKKSNNLFVDLPKLEPELKKWLKKAEAGFSANASTMANAWLKEGLKPRCITRDIKWGIKVPKKGFEDRVFYSWFDAPIGYIGITAEKRDDWKKWWLDKKTKLVQFMGKDNIPFHTIMFPSFLIGTKQPYTLVSNLSVNEYLNYEGGQFSKSLSRGIFADDALATGISSDIWRYYLMINRPEKADTEFLWDDFQVKINNELVANFGNLVYRTLSFTNRFLESKIADFKVDADDKKFLELIRKSEKKTENLMENISLKDALKEIMHISKLANQYFQKNEPWAAVKNNKKILLTQNKFSLHEKIPKKFFVSQKCKAFLRVNKVSNFKNNIKKAEATIGVLANVVKDLSILIGPFMPGVSAEIKEQLNIKEIGWKELGKLNLKNHKIKKAKILFKKLEDEKMAELKKQFGGEKEANVKENAEEKFPLNLKVAKIKSAEDHPKADRLIVLKIDLGKEKRQIVAGLKEYYSKEEMVGKKIIVVTNLKPAVLRGIESNGMLLAAEDQNRKVGLLTAGKSSAGDAVYFEGIENDNKEITFDEFKKIKMIVKTNKVIYKNKIMKTCKEEVTVERVKDNAEVR